MTSGLDILDPTAPLATQETLEQRLAKKIESFKARLSDLERTRMPTGAGAGLPLSPTLPGTRWMDTAGRRFYVYDDTRGWYSVDAARAEAFDASQVSTASTDWVDLGGPSLTTYVPEPGVLSLQIDCELFSVNNGPTFGNLSDAQVALVQPDGSRQLALNLSSQWVVSANPQSLYNAWWRMLSAAGRDTFLTGGARYPNGGFLTIPVGQGTHTWRLEYRVSVRAGAPQTVSFRNRRLWAVVL